MVERTITAMGGEIYFFVEEKGNEEKILDFMEKRLFELITIFNVYDQQSTLSKLNKHKKIIAPEELLFLLEKSLELYEETQGLFNVCLGKQIQARKNETTEIQTNKDTPKKQITIKNNTISISENCLIDLGGIAKGYILDKVKEKTIKEYPSVKNLFIDGRGDCVSYGPAIKEVIVADPFYNNTIFSVINMTNGTIVTSGHDKQYFNKGSHIIGSETELFTLTLYAKKLPCYYLDALATAFLQLPVEKVMELIEFDKRYTQIECLCILRDGTIVKSQGFF